MATVLNTMYPPQVETFMPSFCYNGSAEIWFKISSYNEDSLSDIKFIHVSMVDQRNNKNVFAGVTGNVYPQYYPLVFNQNSMWDAEKKMYKITVPPQVIKTNPYYNTGQYYKVQLRFDLTGSAKFPAYSGKYSNPTSFFYWNNNNSKKADALGLAAYTNYNEDNFSEWSTGTLIKPILIPSLAIQKFNTAATTRINPSTDVLISGKLNFNKYSADKTPRVENEQLSWYQIKVTDNARTTLLYDTDRVYTDVRTAINQINYRANLSMLSINSTYKMQIYYETNNGYTGMAEYPIRVIDYTDITDIHCEKEIDEEDGKIILSISNLTAYDTGFLVVRRSSHYSDFTNWDLVGAYDLSTREEDTFVLIDNTIESMTGYRYQLQYINGDTIHRPLYIEDNDILHCDFYGGLFSDKDKALKISFDFQISNRSNAVNRTKIDTLGGQYPIFTQNAKLKYKTYAISGRISAEDAGETFLPKISTFGPEYYNYRYNPTVKTPHTKQCQTIKPSQDWLYEREYRDVVEDWLNNGKPKLFRSMTEGNLVVMLDSISMTPDTVLGRRLYDFSAMMYEIGDGKDISSIASLDLFDVVDER